LSDDVVQKATNPILAAKEFYSTNSATLNAAADALVNLNSNAGLQRAAKDVLAPVRKIIDGLDSFSKVHPFVAGLWCSSLACIPSLISLALAVGVLLFKAVIEIELKRRENDKRTLSLVLQMADMMGTLLQRACSAYLYFVPLANRVTSPLTPGSRTLQTQI
jgi:hypothetical protein